MASSSFKDDLISKLQTKKLAESSIKNYVRNLELLNDNKPFKNFAFLHDVENITSKLDKYKDNTKRGYLVAIVSALDTSTKAKDKKLRSKYYDLMINKSKEIKEKQPPNEKTETQARNWVDWKDVTDKFNALDESVDKFKNNKTITNDQYNTLLKWMVLALYIFDPARRNMDFLKMVVVSKYKESMPNDVNYLDIDGGRFIFNVYKTAKKYGQQIIKINDTLKEVIAEFFKFHPLVGKKKITTPVPFLVYHDGEPFKQINAITRILNNIFEPKKIGASMLRHIFLSGRYGDILKEQKKDAEQMGHSLDMQRDYIKIEEPQNTTD